MLCAIGAGFLLCLPNPPFLSKYPVSPQSLRRVEYGRPEKESLALAPQHATLASCAAPVGLCGVPGLRRVEAAASRLPGLRPLRRSRSGHAGGAGFLIRGRRRGARAP